MTVTATDWSRQLIGPNGPNPARTTSQWAEPARVAPGMNGGYTSGSAACFRRLSPIWSAACRKADLSAIAALLQNRGYSARTLYSWRRAANVQLVPIKMCAQLKAGIRRAAANNGTIRSVQTLAASDPLISASLGRTRYGVANVLGVDQSNGMLSVYVYWSLPPP